MPHKNSSWRNFFDIEKSMLASKKKWMNKQRWRRTWRRGTLSVKYSVESLNGSSTYMQWSLNRWFYGISFIISLMTSTSEYVKAQVCLHTCYDFIACLCLRVMWLSSFSPSFKQEIPAEIPSHAAVIENNSNRFNFFSPQSSNKSKYLHNFHINASFKCKLQLADKLMS